MDVLVLGSSHARTIRRTISRSGEREPQSERIAADGISGGRLSAESHRRWWVPAARAYKPRTVLLLVGGNDLCQPDVDFPELARQLIKLGRELRAVGVGDIYFFPVLPRLRTRGVSAQLYERRQAALNRIWATRFRGPPITFVNQPVGSDMIGADGVHLSEKGVTTVMHTIKQIQRRS